VKEMAKIKLAFWDDVYCFLADIQKTVGNTGMIISTIEQSLMCPEYVDDDAQFANGFFDIQLTRKLHWLLVFSDAVHDWRLMKFSQHQAWMDQ